MYKKNRAFVLNRKVCAYLRSPLRKVFDFAKLKKYKMNYDKKSNETIYAQSRETLRSWGLTLAATRK